MVRIITDSGCDLTPAQAAALNVTLIPLNVTLEDGSVLRDGIETEGDSYYDHMKTCKKLPKTSQPAPSLFARAFDETKAAGDEAVCLCLCASLSGTYQSAVIAQSMSGTEDCVHVVDTHAIALGEGLLVRRACALRDEGLTAAQIASEIDRLKNHLHLYAVIDDLKYLHKGGRLPKAVAIAGGMLGIKPLITLQADGTVGLCGKSRGLPGAYAALLKYTAQFGGLSDTLPASMAYTDSIKALDPIHRYFTVNLKREAPIVSRVGAVIGTHAGPGAFAIAFFDKGADQ